MKIVTYNINGLRPRVLQFGSLRKLLDSLDADIICFQETKLSRQDLTADLVIADGYECFFSCTRTSEKGRIAYSGVATFCRVKSAFSSNEVALPLAAEEGFTGVLGSSKGSGNSERKMPGKAEGLEEFTREELLKVDNEGRCVMTDHGHFVLFNIYGPRADSEDTERIEFKHTFYTILQKRCEVLLHQGRRVIILGDLNIAPAAIDSCNPGPDFGKNKFRRWFRFMLVENGGNFFDVYRVKHPDKRDAYTQWCQSSGAEEFNYGSRIDHILCARSCLHEDAGTHDHNFVTCHVKECDIMTQFKRSRPGSTPRWKGGRNVRLEGSDHVPVYMSLMDIPNILQHSTPSLSARYAPEVRGIQQTIVSLLMKRQSTEQTTRDEVSSSLTEENCTIESCVEIPTVSHDGISNGSILEPEGSNQRRDDVRGSYSETARANISASGSGFVNSSPSSEIRKKAKQSSQLSLKSFFQTNPKKSTVDQGDVSSSSHSSIGALMLDKEIKEPEDHQSNDCSSAANEGDLNSCCSAEVEKSNVALLEWQRIQQIMRNSVPLCKGHREPCVTRVVKKAGPTLGRRFYVCARAEGPASNPETNCGYFKWAASKPRGQG